jgi:hypothetical protein
MNLTERVANFMATSQPGDAIALSKDADVDAGTGVVLRRKNDGLWLERTRAHPVPAWFGPSHVIGAAKASADQIGTTLDF